MSETADLLRAIASLLWVAIGIALVILLAKVLVAGKDTMARFRTSPTTQEPRHSGSSGT